MFENVIELCRTSITTAVNFFTHFSNKLGFVSVLLGLFLLYSVIKFLIIPLIGSGMSGFSDVARKQLKKEKGGKKK